jgi:hypothetical protein
MADACDLYISPPSSTTWRTQAFPSGNPAVIRMSAGELTAARRAWNFFELVETADAATRVRLSSIAGGWVPPSGLQPASIWYPLSAPGDFMLYRKGQQLHRRICPNYNWTSQRNLPIPTSYLTDVGPALCPDCSGGEAGAMEILITEPTLSCTLLDAATANGGTRSVVAAPTRSIPVQRSGISAPTSTPKSSNTPKTSTTPHASNTPKSSTTPLSSTPQTSNTPMSSTPQTSNTPNPPGTPVIKETPISPVEKPEPLNLEAVKQPEKVPTETAEMIDSATTEQPDMVELVITEKSSE